MAVSAGCSFLSNSALGGGLAFIPNAGALPPFLLAAAAGAGGAAADASASAAAQAVFVSGNVAAGWGPVVATGNFTAALVPNNVTMRTGSDLVTRLTITDGYGQARARFDPERTAGPLPEQSTHAACAEFPPLLCAVGEG